MSKTSRTATAISLVVVVVGGLIVESLKDFPLSRWVGRGARSIWEWLHQPFTVQRWYLYILGGMAVGLVLLAMRRVLGRRQPPWVRTYRSDRFLELDWKWNYWGNQVQEGTVTPFCPRCGTEMVYSRDGPLGRTIIGCTECNWYPVFEGYPNDIRNRVFRLATRSITTGAWQEAKSKTR